MDPPFTIEQFLDPLSRLAVYVEHDAHFEQFIEQLKENERLQANYSPIHYDHETVLIDARIGTTSHILQPSLKLAQELGYRIVKASDFLLPEEDDTIQTGDILELLPCR